MRRLFFEPGAAVMNGDDVLAWQRFLIRRGLLPAGADDGFFGPQTSDATKAFQQANGLDDDAVVGPLTASKASTLGFTAPVEVPKVQGVTGDPLGTVHPELARRVRSLIDKTRAANPGIDSRVHSGLRSFEEQAALFALGRNPPDPSKIVTNAQPGESYHNYGLAVDVVSFREGKFNWDADDSRARGTFADDVGLEWGGNWRDFVDLPHFQLTGGLSIARCLAIHRQGGVRAVWDAVDERLSSRDAEAQTGDEVE